MDHAADYLINIRRIIKLHESMLKEICQEYRLTLTEGTIISFLHNNPGRDTAADIVELRMLQKGNVSQAVEQLVKKSFLKREQDEEDRRKIHLHLTAEAEPAVRAMDRLWEAFQKEIFSGVAAADMNTFAAVNKQIRKNVREAIARREKNER